jgi:hypothetical protein
LRNYTEQFSLHVVVIWLLLALLVRVIRICLANFRNASDAVLARGANEKAKGGRSMARERMLCLAFWGLEFTKPQYQHKHDNFSFCLFDLLLIFVFIEIAKKQ